VSSFLLSTRVLDRYRKWHLTIGWPKTNGYPLFKFVIHQRFEVSQNNAENASEILIKRDCNLQNSHVACRTKVRECIGIFKKSLDYWSSKIKLELFLSTLHISTYGTRLWLWFVKIRSRAVRHAELNVRCREPPVLDTFRFYYHFHFPFWSVSFFFVKELMDCFVVILAWRFTDLHAAVASPVSVSVLEYTRQEAL